MPSSLESLLHAGAAAWPGLIVAGTLKAGLIVAIGGLVATVLRGRSAATRHVAWTLSLIAALAVPFAATIVPAWRHSWLPTLDTVPLRITPRTEPAQAKDPVTASAPIVPAREHDTPARTPAIRPSQAGPRMDPVPSSTTLRTWNTVLPAIERAARHPSPLLVTLVWLAGALCVLLRRALASFRLARLSRRATTVTDPAWLALLASCSLRLGVRRGVALRMSDTVSVPMTWGTFVPVVLLPASAVQWRTERRRMVLLHELAHVRRLDTLSQALAQLATALHWFNPLVWRAASELRREAEQACDDRVLAAGTRASAYAGDLLDIARSAGANESLSSAALAMARPSQLEGRLLAILDTHRPRTGAGRAMLACGVLAAMFVTVAVAAIAPEDSDDSARQVTHATSTAQVPTESVTAAASPAARVADNVAAPAPPVVQQALTATAAAEPAMGTVAAAVTTHARHVDDGRSSMSIIDDGKKTTWKGSWTSDHGTARIRAEGTIGFNDDATDIVSISPGGWFSLEIPENGRTRRVEIRNTSGRLERTYWVNGNEQAWDQEARTWLAAAFLDLARSTGIMVDQRFKGLMAKGGPSRVLEEIPQVRSDYAQGLYFDRLLDTALDRPSMRRVIELAGRELGSDYELAKVLAKAVDRKALDDPEAQASFLAATDQLESDYEHARVLMMVVSRHQISSVATATALRSATRLSSDYERGRVLIALAEHAPFDLAGERLYLKAASAMSSDYEHSQALTALIGRQKLDASSLAPLLESIASIKSDYYRSNLLIALLAHTKLGPQERDLYRRAAKAISSEYYRNQALAALADGGGD